MHKARRATSEDAKRIAEIQVAGWKAAYRGIIPDGYLDAMEPETRHTFWQKQVRDECGEMFVSVADNEVTGFCHLMPSRDVDGEGTAEIVAIYVDPAAWRQGSGRSLCDAVLAAAILSKASWVTLWVLVDNTLGRRFYEAMGFRPDGAIKSEDRPGFTLEEVRYRIDPRRREQDVTANA
jgi:ribosomal protein S18 acetylase RimI-like enzyme